MEDAKIIHFFQDEHRIKTEWHNLKSVDSKSIRTDIYTYENDKIINRTIYYGGTDSINIYIHNNYFWNEDQALFSDGYTMNGEELLHLSRDSVFYNNENIIKFLLYNIPANRPESKTLIDYTDNKISYYSHHIFSNNTWTDWSTRSYIYNANGYLIQIDELYWETERTYIYSFEEGSGNIEQINKESNWPVWYWNPY